MCAERSIPVRLASMVAVVVVLHAGCHADNPAYLSTADGDAAASGPDAAARDNRGAPTVDVGANPSDAARTTLPGGLVGYWKFEEARGATMAMDSSGNGNHG